MEIGMEIRMRLGMGGGGRTGRGRFFELSEDAPLTVWR